MDAKEATVCTWETEGQRTRGLGREPQKASAVEPRAWRSTRAGRQCAPAGEGCTLLAPACVFLSLANVI